MIEATCTACGNINRVAEDDLPSGTKFVTCASCKARVAIPLKDKGFDLADLPAPKRNNALGPDASRPAPRSGLAAALDAELPAPRGAPPRAGTPTPALDLDDLLAPPGASLGVSDLPTPKGAASRAAASDSKVGVSDLPAPKPRPRPHEIPAIKPPPALTGDLPAPKRPGVVDLPMPKPRVPAIPPSALDLPPPIDVPVPKSVPGGVIDLPAPRAPGSLDDLPSPKPQGHVIDLPTPKPGARPPVPDLLTPVGAKPSGDLPAPKGFFDDLPQPAATQPPHGEGGLPALADEDVVNLSNGLARLAA
ncbi:MAG: hypothetical protein WKG01_38495, partial [Kofleriaceae bacterium]